MPSASDTTPQYLLSTAQAAESIAVSVKTLRNWRSLGLGPRYVRLSPNDVRYRPADVAAWVDAVDRAGGVKAVGGGAA